MAATGQQKLPKIIGGCELITRVGQGGMGTVFKARQVSLDRIVAIKVLPPSMARKDPIFIERFLREARTSAKLNHPNIVQGIDVGQDQDTGLYYFVMEFVDGPNLKALLREKKALPERQALEITRDVAQALHCAHKAGIIHRDIKPDNILLTSRNETKLADLGLARFVLDTSLDDAASGQQGGGSADLTQAGSCLGTPAYMSPEQVRGLSDQVDARSDLYALGGTLFQMLTGHAPFAGSSAQVIMQMHLNSPVPDVRDENPSVSEETQGIIEKLMRKNPDDRYPSAEALDQHIERVLQGERGVRITARRTAVTTGGVKPITQNLRRSERLQTPAAEHRRSPLTLLAGGVALLAIGAAVGAVLISKDSPPQTPPPMAGQTQAPPAGASPANPHPAAVVADTEDKSKTGTPPSAVHSAPPAVPGKPVQKDEPLPKWEPYEKACSAARQAPRDYARLIQLFQDAEKDAPLPVISAARRERTRLESEQRQAFQAVFAEQNKKAQAKAGEKEFGEALALLGDEHFPPETLSSLTRPHAAAARADLERRAAGDYAKNTAPALQAELRNCGQSLQKLNDFSAKITSLAKKYGSKTASGGLEELRRAAAAQTEQLTASLQQQNEQAFREFFDDVYQAATAGNLKDAEKKLTDARQDGTGRRFGGRIDQFLADLKSVRAAQQRAGGTLSGKIGSGSEVTLHPRGMTVSGKLTAKQGSESQPLFMLDDSQGGAARSVELYRLDASDVIALGHTDTGTAAGRYSLGLCHFWLGKSGRSKAAEAWSQITKEDAAVFSNAAVYLNWIREKTAAELMDRIKDLYKQARTQPDKRGLQEEAKTLMARLKAEYGTTEVYRAASQKK